MKLRSICYGQLNFNDPTVGEEKGYGIKKMGMDT